MPQRLATPQSLGGTALDREASFGEVAVYGAEAAHAIGDRNRVAGFADLVIGTRAEGFVRALLLDPAASTSEHVEAWRAALASAETMEQQRRALSELAMLGELDDADLAIGKASRAIGDVQAEILSARNDAAQGHVDRAVMSLRSQAESNSAAAEILVEVLQKSGRIDEALAECDRAIARFGGGKITHDKLNILAMAGQIDEADAYATTLLAGQDLAAEHRVTLRRRLIQNRADKGIWPEVEQMCREALAETRGDADFGWGLITAQANQGHLDQAWATYKAINPAVTRPETVHLWMRLHARFGFTEQDIGEALDFVDRWHDVPEVGERVFSIIQEAADRVLLDGRSVLPDPDPSLLARFHAELVSYVSRYPNGPLRMGDIQDVDVTQVIRDQLRPQAGSLNRAVKRVRSGELPLGALAAAASRPYATMLVAQSGGPLYAVTPNHEFFAREVAAAKEAVNGEVVVGASTLAVITLLPKRAPTLLAAFKAVRLPRPALVDIEAAWSDLTRAPASSFSVIYDADHDTLITKAVSLTEHQRLYRRIAAVDRSARQLVVTDLATSEDPPDGHRAWLSAVDLAAERQLLLWSDDVAVRSIAAGRDVTSFGTWALLAALIELGLIPDTTEDDAAVLAREGVIQFAVLAETKENNRDVDFPKQMRGIELGAGGASKSGDHAARSDARISWISAISSRASRVWMRTTRSTDPTSEWQYRVLLCTY